VSSFRFAVIQVSLAGAAVLLCLAAATQWAAAMLANQPALGAPLIDLLGLKLYPPWKLFTWWLAFDAQAPHVFARAGG
jgi:type IV secretion system protein VirD4